MMDNFFEWLNIIKPGWVAFTVATSSALFVLFATTAFLIILVEYGVYWILLAPVIYAWYTAIFKQEKAND